MKEKIEHRGGASHNHLAFEIALIDNGYTLQGLLFSAALRRELLNVGIALNQQERLQ